MHCTQCGAANAGNRLFCVQSGVVPVGFLMLLPE